MFIGPKKIKETKNGEFTPNGIEVIEVFYEDNTREVLSKLMYDKIISEESCDLTKLREKRVETIVEQVLTILRNWGIKVSELMYFSSLLNLSMQQNEKEALKELWREMIPTIADPDDVDMIAVDLVLKRIKDRAISPIISPYNEK